MEGLVAGAAVGLLAQEILNMLKRVYSCRKECEKLGKILERIPPSFKVKRETGNEDRDKWLSRFESLLYAAKAIVEKCGKPRRRISCLYASYKYAPKISRLVQEIDSEFDYAIPLETLEINLELRSHMSRENAYIFQHQDVPKIVLGMEERLEKLKKTVIEKSSRTVGSSYIGITGQGGRGKTLLAKRLTNDEDIHGIFGKESILWMTVGHDAVIPNKYEIMRRFLGIPETSAKGTTLTDQRTQVVHEFSKKKVLLILDDVWDTLYSDQETQTSLQTMEWLDVAREGAGSVTLVTTRELQVFHELDNAEVEEMALLSKDDSWDLFCNHAFPEGIDWLGWEVVAVAKEVCSQCGRLPLALKVVGSAMRAETNIEDWRCALVRLKESRPIPGCRAIDTKLYGRLRTSYDGLDWVVQKCFLYFAALTEDTEILEEDLYKLWISEDLFGEGIAKREARDEARYALKLLCMRSLLEVRREDESDRCLQYFHVHDCLRDVAISIFRGFEVEVKKCPLMSVKDLGKLSKDISAVANLKVKRMSLIFNDRDSPILDHERTCILELHVKALISLNRVMGPDFFLNMGNLRYLEMTHMSGLEELPESITRLGFLRFLDVSSCEALKRLPGSIGDLRSLRHLNLGSCIALEELPEMIGDLQSLEHLHLFGCEALKEFPRTITNLQSLQILDLRGCGIIFNRKLLDEIRFFRDRNTCCALKVSDDLFVFGRRYSGPGGYDCRF